VSSELLHGFYLNDALVEPAHGRVTRGTESLHLTPKASEVLLCLAERAGDVVSRERLLNTVWGKGHGSDEALNHAVGEIRRLFADHHDHPTYIQTLPRRGYRLLVDPQPASFDTDSVGSDSVVIGAERGASLDDIGLFENLRQRGVFETALAYLILGWLLIQVADIVFDQLLLPRWAGTFVTVLVIAGFPIALALSWFIEIRDGNAVLDQLSARDKRRRRFGRTYLSVLGGLAIAAFAVFIYDRSIGLPQETAVVSPAEIEALLPVEDNSIAVLPFMPLDDTEESRILAHGIAEDVITRLSRVPGLLVASRGDAFSMAPNSGSAEVRKRLRVAMFVEGSVQFDGDEIRVVAQLIDSDTGFHILSRDFDRGLENYFDFRDEITSLVVGNLRPALPPRTRQGPLLSATNPGFDVYLMYRRGIEASRRPNVEESFDEALQWFDDALTIDDEYAAAFAGKCDTHVEAYIWTDVIEHIQAAEESCATALHLNPNLDVVHGSLGKLYRATGRLDDAESAFQQALAIEPSNASALIGLGEVYRLQKRPKAAENSLRRAIGLHPGDWAAYNALGNFLFRTGRYAEAAEQYRLVVSLDSGNARGFANLGTTLALSGQLESAEPAFRKALELEANSSAYVNLGLLLYNLGRFDQAVELIEKAVDLRPDDYLLHMNYADALTAAGHDEQATSSYGRARDLANGARTINPNDPFVTMDLAWISAALGYFDTALPLIAEAKQAVPSDPVVFYVDAIIHSKMGDDESALNALRQAIKLGYAPRLLQNDPNFARLREDRRFERVLGTEIKPAID
jgi:tetratricopeptide (TPR) repeat protein/DNA-binding winged helix-turn-helix (wHTH) protein